MKIKDHFVLQEIADDYIAVPVAEEAERLKGIIKVNETGAFIWRILTDKDMSAEELVKELTSKYGIEPEKAQSDVDDFIMQIREMGCLEE